MHSQRQVKLPITFFVQPIFNLKPNSNKVQFVSIEKKVLF